MSELESVEDVGTYDSPEQSVAKDFGNINEADCFMLLHPRKMQMSSFIELGYAYECFLLGIHTVRKVCGGYQPATAGF